MRPGRGVPRPDNRKSEKTKFRGWVGGYAMPGPKRPVRQLRSQEDDASFVNCLFKTVKLLYMQNANLFV